MCKIFQKRLLLQLCLPAAMLTGCMLSANAESVTAFSQNSSSVNRLDLYEATFTMDKTWTNPYDNNGQVEVDAYFTPPGGTAVMVPGFWYQGFTRGLTDTTEYLTASGANGWKVRYAPRITGTYNFYIQIIDRTNGTTVRYPSTGSLTFTCVSSSNRGFLKVNTTDPAYFQYEDGSPYVGIGHNLCGWEYDGTANTRGTYDYDTWLTNMSSNKANLTQFDFCEGDQIEWTYNASELPYSSAWNGLGTYNQQTAWKMDYRMNQATSLGIFYRIALSHWEDFDGETGNFPSWGWNRNPYNSVNGGPVADLTHFFTDSTARNYYKRYLRYIVARWGYSKNMLNYELWNEIDGSMVWGSGQSYTSNETNIASWHNEMAAYLKSLDPAHMVTTSFADSRNQPSVWALGNMDFTTAHRYTYYNADYGAQQYETENTVGSLIQSRFVTYPKPVVVGEFALSPAGDIQRNSDPNGIAFHNQLWASVMQRGAATAMHWTWGSYIQNYNLYYHYKPLGIFLNGADLTSMSLYTTYNATARSYGLKTWWKAFIWMQDLNHTFINRALTQDTIRGQVINLSLMDSGTYSVKFYNTYTGDSTTTTLTCPSTGIMHITVPNFLHDIAIKVVKTAGPVGNTNYAGDPGFEGETANQTPSAWSTWPGAAGTDYDADYSEALTPHTGTNRGTHYKSAAYEVYTFQTITGIPNGTYNYKAWVISSGGQAATFIEAKDYGSATLLQTNIPTTSTWTQISVSNIPVTNGQCTIGIYSKGNSGNWVGFDDIQFVRQTGGGSRAADSVHVSGLPAVLNSGMSVYPNPAGDQLFIRGLSEAKNVQVYSIGGRQLIDTKVSGQSLYIGMLPAGAYILMIDRQAIKFIKK